MSICRTNLHQHQTHTRNIHLINVPRYFSQTSAVPSFFSIWLLTLGQRQKDKAFRKGFFLKLHKLTDRLIDWLATGRTRKHLGLNCIRPFVRRLCLFSSVIYRGTSTAPSVRPPRGRAPNRSGGMEPSISEEGKLRARNGRLNFVLSIRLPHNCKRFLTWRKSTTRDPQLYFPSEGRHA
jgi:hypothetical protein